MSDELTSTITRRGRLAAGGWGTFARHYAEMVVVMLLGMVLLDPPLTAALELGGAEPGTWDDRAPERTMAMMGVTMTVPMAAWMRFRGHGWRPTGEMCGAMLVPTAVGMVVLAAGATSDLHGVMAIEHTAMFAAMLGVMLWRRDEYAGHRHAVR